VTRRTDDLDSRASSAWWVGRPHPIRTAVLLAVAPVVTTTAIGLLAPTGDDEEELRWRLVAVLVVMVGALLVVGRARAWRRVAAAGPQTWRSPGILVVPAAVALAPLVTGLDFPALSMTLVLLCGYAATGVFEELWHRGVIVDSLRSVGLRRSALISGALFGVSHLANIAFGQPAAISAAQSVGAFCFGVGFAIFRWRTNALWLLAGIHAVGDLMFKVTGLHGGLLWGFMVGHDLLMLLWALWCLRGADDDVSAAAR